MPDPFHIARVSNLFDRLVIDVPDLYVRHPPNASHWPARRPAPTAAQRLYGRHGLPLSARFAVWRLLHRLRLDQAWFDEFAAYWGGAPGPATSEP